MKKQDSFTKRCVGINNRLHNIPGEKTKRTIYRRVFEAGPIYRSYYGKRIHYCSECGCTVEWKGQKECPQCHVKWTSCPGEEFRSENLYHMVMEAKGDIQLCRVYCITRYLQYGKPADYRVREVERFFYAPTGERRVFTRGVQGLSCYYDAWSSSPEITLKREDRYISYKAMLRYNMTMYNFTIKSLTKQWQYKDIHSLMANYENDSSVLRYIAYPWGETIHETQGTLFRYLVNQKRMPTKDEIKAVNICNRNHYRIDDPSLWLDTMVLLQHFHLDMHNAHYVCPKDLYALHDELWQRKQREMERRWAEERERQRLKRIERDKKLADLIQHWPEHMGKILSLNLTGKNISIRPLQNVNEFKQEADAMHHCVYSMEYWNYNSHPSSLILSAKDGEGRRLATIEYNTQQLSIVQCRAACNQVPERDKEIRQLINSHKADFQSLLKAA